MTAMWQRSEKITVPGGGGTAVFTVPQNCPLERMTIWAVSGSRVVTMTFQTRINGNNYNTLKTVTALAACDVIYRSGGAATENDLIPYVSAADRLVFDPFDVSVLITNNAGSAETVTMFAVGVQHQG